MEDKQLNRTVGVNSFSKIWGGGTMMIMKVNLYSIWS